MKATATCSMTAGSQPQPLSLPVIKLDTAQSVAAVREREASQRRSCRDSHCYLQHDRPVSSGAFVLVWVQLDTAQSVAAVCQREARHKKELPRRLLPPAQVEAQLVHDSARVFLGVSARPARDEAAMKTTATCSKTKSKQPTLH